MARRRGRRKGLIVSMTQPVILDYGFLSNLPESYQNLLGLEPDDGTLGAIYGINSPKPRRATLDLSQQTAGNAEASSQNTPGSVSSFISDAPAVIKAAVLAGWQITTGSSIRGIGQSAKSVAVYVEVPLVGGGAFKYAWSMSRAEFAEYGVLLGITAATGGDADNLVWGANRKPPRAIKRLPDGSSVSSFIEPRQTSIDRAVGGGFSTSKNKVGLLV